MPKVPVATADEKKTGCGLQRIPVGSMRSFWRLWQRSGLQGLLLLLAFVCVARPVVAQHFTFAQYGQKDGLLNLDVGAIVQDAHGVLWVGTENGLFQADGSQFVKVPTYQDAEYGSVIAMHVDAAGRVWVLGARALMYFTGSGEKHLIDGIHPRLASERNVGLTSLPNDTNHVYVLTDSQLYTLGTTDSGASWQAQETLSEPSGGSTYADMPSLHTLTADPQRNSIWSGCGLGLCELHIPLIQSIGAHVSMTVWDASKGIPSATYLSVVVARDGKIWARGGSNVLALDAATGMVTNAGDPSGTTDGALRYSMLLEDQDGSVLANLPEGLARLTHGVWRRMNGNNGLPSSQISAMFFDRSGGFWLAPIGGGMWRWLGYRHWQGWTRSEGMSNDVAWNILRGPLGKLWVAATDDLDWLAPTAGDPESMQLTHQESGMPMREVQTITTDKRGHIWAGTSDGRLIDFDPRTRKQRLVDGTLDFVYEVRGDENGTRGAPRVWVGSSRGLGYVSAEDDWAQVHAVTGAGLPVRDVTSIELGANGVVWISSPDGIFDLQGQTWKRLIVPADVHVVQDARMNAAPDGTLYVQGVLPTPLLHLAVAQGAVRVLGGAPPGIIQTDDFSFILLDSRRWLWVGTDLGVYVSNGTRWVQCTQEDGLLSDDTDTGGVFEDRDGSMWFGTASGMSHLLDPQSLFSVPPPDINVQSVKLDTHDLNAGLSQDFDLRKPHLVARLFATSYARPGAISFRYRLVGLEDEWHISKDGVLGFSSLHPGDYTLQVQASDLRMHTFSKLIEYPFTVLPPWYKRTVSIVLGWILLVGLIAIAWRMSLKRLRESELRLKLKVDEQTAELIAEKNGLERIQKELLETNRRDSLTGLLNRRAIFDVIGRMCRRARRDGSPLIIIMADLDHFKQINDRFGHLVGDTVLRECSERIRETLRPGDAVGRYGGEELLIAISGLDARFATARLEELRLAVAARPVIHGEHSIQITCSFGVAWLSKSCTEVEHIVNAADTALYRAKRKGRNRVEFTLDEEAAVSFQAD
jgi:diguanylate cyclase (GGDEF)-like protein